MAFFVVSLKLQISLVSGSLTVAIILLPVIIRSTEEALKTVPMSFREGSLALGATKLQTIFKVVLPCAVPGIATAVLLSIGRVIGESAALLLTAGTVAQIPATLLSPGSTLNCSGLLCGQGRRQYRTGLCHRGSHYCSGHCS